MDLHRKTPEYINILATYNVKRKAEGGTFAGGDRSGGGSDVQTPYSPNEPRERISLLGVPQGVFMIFIYFLPGAGRSSLKMTL